MREIIQTVAIEAQDARNLAKARAVCEADPTEDFGEVLADLILGRIDRGILFVI